MTTHSQIVITAPHSNILAIQRITVVQGMRKTLCQAIHPLENTICIVFLLLFNLSKEELIIVKVRLKYLQAWSRTCNQFLLRSIVLIPKNWLSHQSQ